MIGDDSKSLNWYDPKRLPYFTDVYSTLAYFSEIIAEVSTENLKTILNHIYSVCIRNIKSFSVKLDSDEDMFRTVPIVHLFAAISDINYTLFQRWHNDPNTTLDELNSTVYYDKDPADIPFCVENGLVGSHNVTIANMNMSELLSAIDTLESKLYIIGYSKELVTYFHALELRVNTFTLFPNKADVHNITNLRARFNPNEEYLEMAPHFRGEELYVCTTYCEYFLCVRILSIARDLEGALDYMRDHEECIRPVFDGEMDAVALIHNNMLHMLQMVHSDLLQDTFSTAYEENVVRTSVGYQWLKMNNYFRAPEPSDSITQYEGDAFWSSVCETTKLTIDEHFYRMNDYVAFWIIFFQIIEVVIISSITNFGWQPSSKPTADGKYVSDYFITNNTIKLLTPPEMDALMIKSHQVPIFIQSLSDASILFQGKLYVFGHSPVDYLRAFHSWIDIIDQCFGGKFMGRIPIYDLKYKMYNPDVIPPIQKYIQREAEAAKNNITASSIAKFTLSKNQKHTLERDARISLLVTTQKDLELIANPNRTTEKPFLAEANETIWFETKRQRTI